MADCTHGVAVGSPCGRCPDGIATRKRRASVDNIAPPRVMPPPTIAFTPIRPPSPVGGMHSLGTGTASSSSSTASPLVGGSTLTNVQLLNALFAYLGEQDASVALVDTVTSREATCWNWALHGAERATHDPDANWAYLYVSRSPFGYEARTHDALAGTIPAAKALLDEARAQWDLGGRLTLARQDAVQRLILQALCVFNGLREVGSGDLELALYYVPSRKKDDGLMYMHFEFIYQDAITITKGNGDQLRAFNGVSGLSEGAKPRRLALCIDPLSLSRAHVTALRDLVRQIPDA